MPDFVAPMRAATAPEPFDSKEHIFELMWGGVRAVALIRDGIVRIRGANGLELTQSFPEFIDIPVLVDAREAILDGEVIVVDSEGFPAFDALRPRLHALAYADDGPPQDLSKPRRITGQPMFQAFDLLWHDGRSLMQKPLWQRKNRLHQILKPAEAFCAVDFVDDEGVAFFDAVVQRRLEGVVAKEKASLYVPGVRTTQWQQVRALHSGDFVIGGYTIGGGLRRGEPFSQLLLGAYDGERLEYVGAVSGGMSDNEARQLIGRLEMNIAGMPHFADPPRIPRLTFWTEPNIACHVRFSEWTKDGYLRFPIFSALRPDIRPEDCVAE